MLVRHLIRLRSNHFEDYTKLDKETISHIYDVADKLTKELMTKLNSKGLTFVVNYGDSQLVKHFHLHVLPDYQLKEKEMDVDKVFEILTK